MSILNFNFPNQVYLITSTKCANRHKFLKEHLRYHRVQPRIVFACEPEQLACANTIYSLSYAYLQIFKTAKFEEAKEIVILEDDVFFLDDWQINLANAFNSLPEKWDILVPGQNYTSDKVWEKEPFSEHLHLLPHKFYGTHFAIYNHTIFDAVLEDLPGHLFMYIDQYFNRLNKDGRKFFCTAEPCADALSDHKNDKDFYNRHHIPFNYDSTMS